MDYLFNDFTITKNKIKMSFSLYLIWHFHNVDLNIHFFYIQTGLYIVNIYCHLRVGVIDEGCNDIFNKGFIYFDTNKWMFSLEYFMKIKNSL